MLATDQDAFFKLGLCPLSKLKILRVNTDYGIKRKLVFLTLLMGITPLKHSILIDLMDFDEHTSRSFISM